MKTYLCTLRSTLKENISRLSLVVAFPSFWPLSFATLEFHNLQGKENFISDCVFRSRVVALLTDFFVSYIHVPAFIPVTQLPHLFLFPLSFCPFSLAMSKAQDICSQGVHQVQQQAMVNPKPSSQNKFPASLVWNIFQECKIFTAFRWSKSLGSK